MGASGEVNWMLFEFARLRRWPIRSVSAAAAAYSLVAGGCSSSSTAPATQITHTSAVCPATPDDTIGKACAVEGTVCGPQYACGTTSAALYCVCTNGSFKCRDGANNELAAGDTPSCPTPPSQPSSCPGSLSAANLHVCSAPGQICAYPSACPGAYDECTCFPGETASGGFGVVYVCQAAICAGDASAPPPPPIEAGPGDDASPPPPPDAGSDDASPDDAAQPD
jgi:hypothetical protein